VLGRLPAHSGLLAVVEGCWLKGELGVASEYLRTPNVDWEADKAPRMAFLVESVIVETGKVP